MIEGTHDCSECLDWESHRRISFVLLFPQMVFDRPFLLLVEWNILGCVCLFTGGNCMLQWPPCCVHVVQCLRAPFHCGLQCCLLGHLGLRTTIPIAEVEQSFRSRASCWVKCQGLTSANCMQQRPPCCVHLVQCWSHQGLTTALLIPEVTPLFRSRCCMLGEASDMDQEKRRNDHMNSGHGD